MPRSGWAYVDLDYFKELGGPTGSVQFLVSETQLSGSQYFVYATASNNIGIGLTSWDGTGDMEIGRGLPHPDHKVQIVGDVSVTGSIYADNYIIKNVSIVESDGDTNFGNTSTDYHEYTGSLSISEKVGIGTATPGAALGIDGDLHFQPTTTSTGHITSAGSLRIRADSNMHIGDNTVDAIRIGRTNTALAKIYVRSGGENDLVVSDSKVGIGMDDPTDALEIDGDIMLSPTAISTAHIKSAGSLDVRCENNMKIGTNGADSVQIGRTNTALAKIYVRSGGENDLVVSNSKVGIGIADPAALLNIQGTATTGASALIVDHDDADQIGAIFNIGSTTAVGMDINLSNTTANAFDLTADAITTASAMNISAGSLDTGQALRISGKDGKTDLKIVSSVDADDYFSIATTQHGATTIATVDAAATAADLIFTIDGDIILGPAGGDVLPDTDSTRNLGSSSKRWANLYTGDLHLKNDRGDWTIVEEAEYLTLINNANGKKYKIMMEEVED